MLPSNSTMKQQLTQQQLGMGFCITSLVAPTVSLSINCSFCSNFNTLIVVDFNFNLQQSVAEH